MIFNCLVSVYKQVEHTNNGAKLTKVNTLFNIDCLETVTHGSVILQVHAVKSSKVAVGL